MKPESPPARWKLEPLLAIAALLLLLVACYVVIKPFLTALIWAVILTYALHPLQRVFTRWFRGSRTLAAGLVTLTLTLAVLGPIAWIGVSLAQDGKELAVATRDWFMAAPDTPPTWMQNTPLIGDEISSYWSDVAESRKRWLDQLDRAAQEPAETPPLRPKIVVEDGNETHLSDAPPVDEAVEEPAGEAMDEDRGESPHLIAILGRLIGWARSGLVAAGLAVTQTVTQMVISAFLAFFLLRDAPALAERLQVAGQRLAGWRGRHLIKVAADTVRGVIYGVLGTAVVQAVVAGIGFAVAGVPGSLVLSVLTFLFAVVPFGPPLIWIPAALWLFAQGSVGWGIGMLLWGTFAISSVDNVVRPFLISQGSKMPFVLIFCGVIGGALAFGLVGVFMGPTVLAVAYRLIEEWSAQGFSSEEPASPSLPNGPRWETPPHGGESGGVG